MRTFLVALSVAALAAVAAPSAATAAAPSASPATAQPGSVVPVTPQRLVNSRVVAAHATTPVTVAGGTRPVPADATAVVINVTATREHANGFLTVYPNGSALPTVSNVNFKTGQPVANLVLARVGTNGLIRVYNGSPAAVAVVVDLSAYVVGGTPPGSAQGAVQPVPTPTRLLDTRSHVGGVTGPVGAGRTISFAVGGHAGVPTGARAAILNVTATAAVHAGFVTAYPTGGVRPTASSLNYAPGRNVPNLVLVPLGTAGKVSLYNGSQGSVQLLADVQGYVTPGDPVTLGGLGVLTPARIADTRTGASVAPHRAVTVSVAGKGGVPRAGVGAVVLNLTATNEGSSGYVTVYGGATRPPVSNLNHAAHETIANLVTTSVSSSEQLTIYNGSSGSIDVIVDVAGWTRSADVSVPQVMSSHYLDNLTGDSSSDQAAMDAEGCTDGTAGYSFVLLDVGAQSYHTPLSKTHPGVALALSSGPVRLTYPTLVDDIAAYLTGFDRCGSSVVSTIAVGTNNAGNYRDMSDPHNPPYPATARGTDWANSVVVALAGKAQQISSNLSVVGANDIENGDPNTDGFDNVFTNAASWETAYFGATHLPLIYNGSANGCPTTYGSGSASTACSDGWTLGQFVSLTNKAQVQVLPQVYFTAQSVQWANIDRVAAGRLSFQGSLTEQAQTGSLTPSEGWAALYHAVGTVVTAPRVPLAVDIEPAQPADASLETARVTA